MDRVRPGVAALEAASDAVVALAAARSLDDVLDQLLVAVRELVDAPWAALGLPAAEGDTFARFTTSGMSPELVARLGDLPRRHGLLATLLDDPHPLLLDDLHDHPDFRGAWPGAHPDMRAFLGVPVHHGDRLLGALYLARGPGAPAFEPADLALVERFAAHAAVAVEHARREEQARDLHTAAERARLAADLHDALSQTLAGATYAAAAVAGHLDRIDPADTAASRSAVEAARTGLGDTRDLLATARRELSAVVDGLRPPRLDRDGLAATLQQRLTLLGRAHGVAVVARLDASPAPPDVELALLRVAEEALSNAVRHGRPARVELALRNTEGGGLELEVADDGTGFDPSDPMLRATRLGLHTMRSRVAALGGDLSITSEPGAGTRVRATLGPEVRAGRAQDRVQPRG